MIIGIAGLGLIGGSLAKAYKEQPGNTVYGYDIDASIQSFAQLSGAIDGVLDRARIGLNAWAPTRKDARDLAADAVRLLLGWPATLATDAPVMARCTMAPSIVSDDEPPRFYAVLALTFRAV